MAESSLEACRPAGWCIRSTKSTLSLKAPEIKPRVSLLHFTPVVRRTRAGLNQQPAQFNLYRAAALL